MKVLTSLCGELPLLLACVACVCHQQSVHATDYFLTLGGGYRRSENQASLEANVLFFQQLLAEQHQGPRQHDIFFADGDDPAADLQVLAEKPAKSDTPATDLLAALHRRGSEDRITYRNHRVADVAGPLDPKLIRTQLETLAGSVKAGDRLVIFVTAHGDEGTRDEPFNTSIDCWDDRKISAREFGGWLDKLPTELPVVLVMAQCYCGGFGHIIFTDLDEKQGLAPQLRVGFFAQQHDLPAAGCRPDIEHDEEFSSYFWGAIAGRSRNGAPINGCDIDGDGVVSFAEAYAHAVIAAETIDIPLRTSEVLLRTYSRLAPETSNAPSASDTKSESGDGSEPKAKEELPFVLLSGRLEDLLASSRPVSSRIVTQLAKALDVSLQDDVSTVMKGYEDQRRTSRPPGRGRRRQGSGRREVLREVAKKWPELGDAQKWAESPLLKAENQEQLLAELKQLPSWRTYDERRQQMATADQASDQSEIRSAKFRRLINALETVVLERNLAFTATPQIVERYQQLVALEESSLHRSAQPPQGFQRIFNGVDLSEWDGNPSYWSVKDGCLTGVTDGSLKHNRFIVWRGEALQNFELRVKVKVTPGGNSGLNYRSKARPDLGEEVVTGYQCDVVPGHADYDGMLYEERGRRILAHTGEKVVIDEKGQPWVVGELPKKKFNPDEWHEYRVLVEGNHHQHWIDGFQTADVIDLDEKNRALAGVLGVQVHVGPAMTIQYKDFFLKRLPNDLPIIRPDDAKIPASAVKVVPQGQSKPAK